MYLDQRYVTGYQKCRQVYLTAILLKMAASFGDRNSIPRKEGGGFRQRLFEDGS